MIFHKNLLHFCGVSVNRVNSISFYLIININIVISQIPSILIPQTRWADIRLSYSRNIIPCFNIVISPMLIVIPVALQTTEYTALSEKFRRAAINLVEDLNKLSYIGGKERWMLRPDEVLEPTKQYSDHFPVNLASCSSTALKMHDTDYSATSTVQNFIQRAWVGVQFIQVHPTRDVLLFAIFCFCRRAGWN